VETRASYPLQLDVLLILQEIHTSDYHENVAGWKLVLHARY
jgi:hypothetical protein